MSQTQTNIKQIHGLLMDIDGSLAAGDVTFEGLMSLVKNWRGLKDATDLIPEGAFRPGGLRIAEVGLRRMAEVFIQAAADAEVDEATHLELVAEAEAALEAAKVKLTLAKQATAKAHNEIKGLGELLG